MRIKKAEEAEEGTGEGNRLTDEAYRQIMEYFSKRRREFDFPSGYVGQSFKRKFGGNCVKSRMAKHVRIRKSRRQSESRLHTAQWEWRTIRIQF